jgi:hypothetical protein
MKLLKMVLEWEVYQEECYKYQKKEKVLEF